MTSHPDTKIDCSKVYVKKSTFSNEETGDFDGAFAAVAIKKGEFSKVKQMPKARRHKCQLAEHKVRRTNRTDRFGWRFGCPFVHKCGRAKT